MNIIYLNIRGIGESHKVEWVNRLKQNFNLMFCGIQEMQISNALEIDVVGCWEHQDFDYDVVEASGQSSGLLCIREKSYFTKILSIKN